MAKNSKKPAKPTTPKTAKTAATAKPAARKPAQRSAASVRVKSSQDVVAAVDGFIAKNLHERFSVRYSKQLQKKLVAYGPWLATLLVLVVLPELMTLAKNGSLITATGFFDTIFFNQESWVMLLVMLANLVLLVDALSHIFNKAKRGWSRIYAASVLTTGYVLWQLFENWGHPASAILALMGCGFVLFSLLDIREYYK